MKLTNAEKLTLTMLADLHEKMGIDEVDTKLLKRAIYSNNTWALSWEMPGIVGDSPEPTPPEVSLVVDVLDMWSFIEEAYERFDPAQKTELEAKADPFGKHVEFSGFDGNNESELMSIANFLVNDMKRFSRFAGRDLNSHCQVVDGYRRMLEKFLVIRPNLSGRGLSVAELAEVLNTRRHE
jgi:hypothetical protein